MLQSYITFTTLHPYLAGFIKFAILATLGELLARRIASKRWEVPKGILYRMLIWGLLGVGIVLIFAIFSSGVATVLEKGLLPGNGSTLAFAFFTSLIMNLTFAPVMMAFHRITDTYIDMLYGRRDHSIRLADVFSQIDWRSFSSFVLFKTIPLFWIPAHTITFLLEPEFRVLFAALLSFALGLILAFAKKASR